MVRFDPGAAHVAGVIGLDDLDLGLPAKPAPSTAPPSATDSHVAPRPLIPGSVLARALYAVMAGEPVVCVDSPPGAGKSTLVADVVAHLHRRTDLKVMVGAFTRQAAAEIAGRIAAVLPPGTVVLGVRGMDLPVGVVAPGVSADGERRVTVNTLASYKASGGAAMDVLVVDEAYQATFALVASAAAGASQVLLVGDPGQIGPVAPFPTHQWRGLRQAGHMRAPEVYAQRPGAVRLSLATTHRLGQATVDAIGCLYDFPFTSSRPDRRLVGWPELTAEVIDRPARRDDLAAMAAVADIAERYVGEVLDEPGQAPRALAPSDVCVVAAHNAQVSTIAAVLRSRGLDDVTVGTADSLQGAQWHAVVALDPLTGVDTLSDHHTSLGRLCVMASRHLTHLCWVHDGTWPHALHTADIPEQALAAHLTVRAALTAQ